MLFSTASLAVLAERCPAKTPSGVPALSLFQPVWPVCYLVFPLTFLILRVLTLRGGCIDAARTSGVWYPSTQALLCLCRLRVSPPIGWCFFADGVQCSTLRPTHRTAPPDELLIGVFCWLLLNGLAATIQRRLRATQAQGGLRCSPARLPGAGAVCRSACTRHFERSEWQSFRGLSWSFLY